MTYKSFATFAVVLAAVALVGAPTAKADAASKQASTAAAERAPALVDQSHTPSSALYAQAGTFGESSATRLDAQPVEARGAAVATTTLVKARAGDGPMDLWSLVIAGMAVMGSLAFRRSPNK